MKSIDCRLMKKWDELKWRSSESGREDYYGLLIKVVVAVFIYSTCAMLAYQLWIIEYMSSTAVNGLLAGDPQYYHQVAVDLCEKIVSDGWSAWRLRPEGMGSAGLLAVFYYFFGPHPWLVIFINSFAHAVASLFLILILSRIVPVKYAFMASIFFIMSPFQMHWLSQINKESYVILGFFIFIYGVVVFFERKIYAGLGYMILGVALIAICRPYIVQLLFIATILLGCLLVLCSIKRKEYLSLGFILLLVSPVFIPFMSGAQSDQTIGSITFANMKNAESVKNAEGTINLQKYAIWTKSSWLPEFIDMKLFALSYSKAPYEFLTMDSNATVRAFSLVDEAIFHSAADVFIYMPRALQLALFSPFPKDWPIFSDINDGSTFRLMVSCEMIFAYVCFLFLLIGLFKNGCLKLLIPVYYSLFILQVYGLAIPHVGVMYRYKYSYFIFLVSLGAAFLIKYLIERKNISFCVNDEKRV